MDLSIGHSYWPFTVNKLYIIKENMINYTFFYKQLIFSPLPQNCLADPGKSPIINFLAIV